MILAHATSVRMSKSKLRPHIISGALLSLTLLKSKQRWKLTEVVTSKEVLVLKSLQYKVFLKLLSVLKSLVFGEERNESLFESILGAYQYLKIASIENLSAVECLAMIKILHSLGYGEPKNNSEYEKASWNDDVITKVSSETPELISGINKALEATGL